MKNIAKILPFCVNAAWGKKNIALREITPFVSIIQPFQILIGKFQNHLNKALRKIWMIGYFKCSKC